MPATAQDLDTLLEQSAATSEFKAAVKALRIGRGSGDLVKANAGAPPVKVLRVISKLLEEEPATEIREVEIRGQSGCSDFAGSLWVNGENEYRFVWDCRWRAEQEGMTDHWGYPDQRRAVEVFGYQCFEEFQRVA